MLQNEIKEIHQELEKEDICIWSLKAGGVSLCPMPGPGCLGREHWQKCPKYKELEAEHSLEMWLRVVADARLGLKK